MTDDEIDAGRTVTLEKIKVGLMTVASEYLLDASVEVYQDHLCQQVEFQLRGFLLGEKIESVTIEYPDGWWEAFKLEVLPLWLKKLFAPVKYCHHTITAKAVYPDFKPALPKERYVVMLNEE